MLVLLWILHNNITLNVRKTVRSSSTMMDKKRRLMDMLESSKGLVLFLLGEWIWKFKNLLKLKQVGTELCQVQQIMELV